jgi:hypothetical protein
MWTRKCPTSFFRYSRRKKCRGSTLTHIVHKLANNIERCCLPADSISLVSDDLQANSYSLNVMHHTADRSAHTRILFSNPTWSHRQIEQRSKQCEFVASVTSHVQFAAIYSHDLRIAAKWPQLWPRAVGKNVYYYTMSFLIYLRY